MSKEFEANVELFEETLIADSGLEDFLSNPGHSGTVEELARELAEHYASTLTEAGIHEKVVHITTEKNDQKQFMPSIVPFPFRALEVEAKNGEKFRMILGMGSVDAIKNLQTGEDMLTFGECLEW